MGDDERDIRALLEAESERAPRPQGLRRSTIRRGLSARISVVVLPALVIASVAWMAVASPFAMDSESDVVAPGPQSRDGLIAFTTQAPDEPTPWIATVAASGGNVTRLREGRDPSWSPDGTKIAFSCYAGICTMEADGSNVQTLTSPTGSALDEDPDWGPNGLIAFTRSYLDGKRGRDIFLIREDGGKEEILGEPGPDDSAPTWSPDGSQIAFIRGVGQGLEAPSGGFQLFVTSTEGSPVEERQLTTRGAERPDWSPDGQTILFDEAAALWTVPAGGGEPTKLPVVSGEDFDVGASPSWAHDSRRIAYICSADGDDGNDICLSERDSKDWTALVATDQNEASPAWQPAVPSGEVSGDERFGRYTFTNDGGYDRQDAPVEYKGIVEVDSRRGSLCVESQILGASSAHLHREDDPAASITIFEPPETYRPTMCAKDLDPGSLQAVIDDPTSYYIEFHNRGSGGTLSAQLEIMEDTSSAENGGGYVVGSEEVVMAFGNEGDIWLALSDGSVVNITDSPETESSPTISFDDKVLVYEREGKLAYHRLDTGESAEFADGYSPAFGPLDYLAWDSGAGEVVVGSPFSDWTVRTPNGLRGQGATALNLAWDQSLELLYYSLAVGHGVSPHYIDVVRVDGWECAECGGGLELGTVEALRPDDGIEGEFLSTSFGTTVDVLRVCCRENEADAWETAEIGNLDHFDSGDVYNHIRGLDDVPLKLTGDLLGLSHAGSLAATVDGEEVDWRTTNRIAWFVISGSELWLVAENREPVRLPFKVTGGVAVAPTFAHSPLIHSF